MISARIAAFADEILAQLRKPSRILEIGCGSGELAAVLRSHGHSVVALDPKAPQNVDALHLRFEEYDPAGEPFAAVVTQLVLHHSEDLSGFLEKAARVLERGGFIAIDDYGWERESDGVPQSWRDERRDLHTSEAMLRSLRARFEERRYFSHPHLDDGAGNDSLGFTFIGTPA